MVFYRKYRPQKIADLDSTAVRETLTSVLKKNIPHAFLFTGPKGLGKTSTARIVAKAVNCERVSRVPQVPQVPQANKTQATEEARGTSGTRGTRGTQESFEPCNECDQCISITSGNNLDVLEIDAASNRGIDEIRDLKEKIRLAPVSSKMKVYIIDEVHMLTTEAFNALLKTLEEPPEHAMFILATTEPHKVPATILSRCFHINFSLATTDEIVRSLKRVSEGEKLTIGDDALLIIAQMAEGGFRDGTKLLEEAVLVSGGKPISKELLETSFKSTSVLAYIESLLTALQHSDAKAGLEVVKTLVGQGVDVKYFLQQVIEELHRMLLSEMGVKNQEARIKPSVGKQVFSLHEIKLLVALFSQAFQETKFAVIASLPLELAIIEWCSQESSGLSSSLSEEKNETISVTENGVTVSSMLKQVGARKKQEALYGTPKKVKEVKETVEVSTVELHHTPADGTITKEWLDHFWKNLINEMKNHNHTAAGVLRSCSIKSYDGKALVIAAAYKFHKERLDDFKTKDALVTVTKMLTGKTVEVAIELKQ